MRRAAPCLQEAQGSLGRPAAPGSQACEGRMEGGPPRRDPRLQQARRGEEGADGGPGDSRLSCAVPGAASRALVFPPGSGCASRLRECARRLCSGPLLGALSTLRDVLREPPPQASDALCALGTLEEGKVMKKGLRTACPRQPFPNPLPSAPASLPWASMSL